MLDRFNYYFMQKLGNNLFADVRAEMSHTKGMFNVQVPSYDTVGELTL